MVFGTRLIGLVTFRRDDDDDVAISDALVIRVGALEGLIAREEVGECGLAKREDALQGLRTMVFERLESRFIVSRTSFRMIRIHECFVIVLFFFFFFPSLFLLLLEKLLFGKGGEEF